MGRKLSNTEQFILKATKVHGNRYDYSKTIYVKAILPVTIICPKHGEFEQPATSHLSGHVCPRCSVKKIYCFKTKLEFIEAANKIHNHSYDYSKATIPVKDSRTKITITCPIHGDFQQTIYSHMSGSNCPACARLKCIPLKTTERFIQDAIKIYNNKYDYSKTNYVHSGKKIIIICPEHGEFVQTPQYHLSGNGCLKCKRAKHSKIKVIEVFSCSRLNQSETRKGILNPLKQRR
jgi:hypothetical protein